MDDDQIVIENAVLNSRTIFAPDGTEREEPIDPSRRIRQARGCEIEIREAKPRRIKPKHRPRRGKKLLVDGKPSFNEGYLLHRVEDAEYHAALRGFEFNITAKDIRELLELQNYKCYYSGIEFEDMRGSFTNGAENAFGFSIDRKDSKRGYTRDNIVLCCNVINTSKGQMSSEDYLKRVWKEATDAFRVMGWGEPTEKDVWGFLY